MKTAVYLAERLKQLGVATVFGYQGSSISHTIDALESAGIRFVEARHEQGAAFEANGYAMASGEFGVCAACSGPGAINVLAGIAQAYYDSIPCLFITGQVSVKEIRKDTGLRQMGFQETDICAMALPITKYAVSLRDPLEIALRLEEALWHMHHGRPGPVLLDIPHNIQGSQIDPDALLHFKEPEQPAESPLVAPERIQAIARELRRAKRPLILLGGGCRTLRKTPALRSKLERLRIPCAVSYLGRDVLPMESDVFCGTIGAYGNRQANWAALYADFVLVMGSRLDGRQTPDGWDAFAPQAHVVVVDIDPAEMAKYPDRFERIQMDAVRFLEVLLKDGPEVSGGKWLNTIFGWRERRPDWAEYNAAYGVNPNLLLRDLGKRGEPNAVFALDVGQNQIWANASLYTRARQRILQSGGLGAMGFAVPAAIGAYFAGHCPVYSITGDGGIQMNLQELQTAAQYGVPLKVVVLNNRSLGLIRVYQDKALQGRHCGSVEGFSSPDYALLAKAYGMKYYSLRVQNGDALDAFLQEDGSCILEVEISGESTNYPEPFYGGTIRNQALRLPEAEIGRIEEEANSERE